MSDEQLSIWDYMSTEHYITDSNDDDQIFRHDAMSQGTCNKVGYRMLRWNIEHCTETVNTEHEL